MQEHLSKLALLIGYLAMGVCAVVFFVGWGLGTTDPVSPATPSWLFMILIAVTLTVAAIPEGLPLCVTIALSSGCASMVKENVLMRKIAAVETLGSASIICTDKTGTLTEGKMTLTAMYSGGVSYNITGKGFDPTVGAVLSVVDDVDSREAPGVRSTLGSAVLCSNTTLKLETDPDKPDAAAKWTPRGNSSEAPIIVAAIKIGVKVETLASQFTRVSEIPFSSSRKMMVTVTKSTVLAAESIVPHLPKVAGEYTAHVKGAPNYIIEKCSSILQADGSVLPLDEQGKAEVLSKVDELSSQALRVLAIAFRPIGTLLPFDCDAEADEKFSAIVYGLTFCGLTAAIDPARGGVKEAVATANEAGVRVVMITGDYLQTAVAIAKNIGIMKSTAAGDAESGEGVLFTDCNAMRTGAEGEYISNEDLDKLTQTVNVFARAKPEDKLEIVKSLQRQGLVCAMTGDGVNDAPALQEADIGVSMGLEGTEVARLC